MKCAYGHSSFCDPSWVSIYFKDNFHGLGCPHHLPIIRAMVGFRCLGSYVLVYDYIIRDPDLLGRKSKP